MLTPTRPTQQQSRPGTLCSRLQPRGWSEPHHHTCCFACCRCFSVACLCVAGPTRSVLPLLSSVLPNQGSTPGLLTAHSHGAARPRDSKTTRCTPISKRASCSRPQEPMPTPPPGPPTTRRPTPPQPPPPGRQSKVRAMPTLPVPPAGSSTVTASRGSAVSFCALLNERGCRPLPHPAVLRAFPSISEWTAQSQGADECCFVWRQSLRRRPCGGR